jgi:Fe-S-cluster-containing dehydrogenase component
MRLSRRELLKGALVAGAAGAAAGVATDAAARAPVPARPNSVGMLFDSTLCVGCRACQQACKAANQLPPDLAHAGDGVYDAPVDLNSTTKNVIKLLADGGQSQFMKQQCMHCVDPSCVSVCMMGALHKEGEGKRSLPGARPEQAGTGIVMYDKGLCVGCRYCQIGCAFNVPKFEWREPLPLIVKCELCRHRADEKKTGPLAVANPACCEVCPRGAVIFGVREELLSQATARVAGQPERYNPHVYGTTEGGGTQVLYLTAKGIRFEQLGLPRLPEESSARFSESVSHAPYLMGVTPVALYAALAFVINRNQKKDGAGHGEEGSR